jgi:hypothetical protein
MNRKFTAGLLSSAVVLSAIAFSGIAHGQANVNEGLETALIYVDGNLGSDSNPGTQALPFKTIGKGAAVAMTNNQNGIGTRVTINPAVYREAIALNSSSKATSLPITLEAFGKGGGVEVSGADVWTGWQPSSANPNIYTNAWPYAWGLCPTTAGSPFEQDIVLRREMIFVNGTLLTQVLSLPQMTRGTFFVDEPNGVVYIYPALGTDIGSATVEVGTRNNLFRAFGLTNFVLRGINFDKGSDCRNNDTVTFNGGTNIVVDNDGFNWNNSGGFGINGATFFTIRDNVAMHNGQRGFKSFEAKNGLWTGDEADYSNWRGSQGGIYAWSAGGYYFFAQHDNTVTNLKMFYNLAHGVHWDTDNANITARSLIAAYNLQDGLVVEKSEGPVSIADSKVCFNAPISLYYNGGMLLRVSTYVTLTSNTFADNYISQIPIVGIQGGIPIAVTNYETGEQYNLLTTNLTMQSNIVVGGTGQQLVYDFDQAGTAWTDFQTTLTSDHNKWWNSSVAQPFTVPVPAYYTPIAWTDWLSETGQDVHSLFEAPATDPTIACQVKADAPDFWFINFNLGSVTVTAGTPAVYTMLLIPIGGFNGTTYFTNSGITSIPGTARTWSQSSLTGSGTVTLTVRTSPKTPPGTYPITVAARSGDVTRTGTFSLIVQ